MAAEYHTYIFDRCRHQIHDTHLRKRDGTLKYEMMKWMMDILDCFNRVEFEKRDNLMANKIFFALTTNIKPAILKVDVDYHRMHGFITGKKRNKNSAGDHFIPVRNISQETGAHGSNSQWNRVPVIGSQNTSYTSIVIRKYIWSSLSARISNENRLDLLPSLSTESPWTVHFIPQPTNLQALPYEYDILDLEKYRLSRVKIRVNGDEEWVNFDDLAKSYWSLPLPAAKQKYQHDKQNITALQVYSRWASSLDTAFICNVATDITKQQRSIRLQKKMKQKFIRKLKDAKTQAKSDLTHNLTLIAAIKLLIYWLEKGKRQTLKTCLNAIHNELERHLYVKRAMLVQFGIKVPSAWKKRKPEYYEKADKMKNQRKEKYYKKHVLEYERLHDDNLVIFPYGFPSEKAVPLISSRAGYEKMKKKWYKVEEKATRLRFPLLTYDKDLLKRICFESFGIDASNTDKYSSLYVPKLSSTFKANHHKDWIIDPIDVILLTSTWERYVMSRGASLYSIIKIVDE